MEADTNDDAERSSAGSTSSPKTNDEEPPKDGEDATGDATSRREIARRLERDHEPLDYSPSSGAVDPDHAAQDTETDHKTGRFAYTENATFTEEELPAESNRWESLNQANRDFYHGEDTSHETERRHQNLRNDVQAWGRQIGLTDYECERATELATNGVGVHSGSLSIESIILAALTIAANEDDTVDAKILRANSAISTVHPDLSNAYEEIRTGLGVTPQAVRQARKILHKHKL